MATVTARTAARLFKFAEVNRFLTCRTLYANLHQRVAQTKKQNFARIYRFVSTTNRYGKSEKTSTGVTATTSTTTKATNTAKESKNAAKPSDKSNDSVNSKDSHVKSSTPRAAADLVESSESSDSDSDSSSSSSSDKKIIARGRKLSSSSSGSSSSADERKGDKLKGFQQPVIEVKADDILITYERGLPQIIVPLPSRKEKCRFTLKPITNTVGDFIQMLKDEDKGIDRVSLLTPEGVRIAASSTIDTVLEENFQLVINDVIYCVECPEHAKLPSEDEKRINDVKTLVYQLYAALNAEEHQIVKEKELCAKLEKLRAEVQPLEEKRIQLDMVAHRNTDVMAWVGLGLMGVQFGILARLTWWEYSWDIMEPVTYFVTYGTAMAAYAYYVLTKQEYILPEVRDRQYLLTLHKKAKKLGFDLTHYNTLCEQIRRHERDLAKLRNPFALHLPPKYLSGVERSGMGPASGHDPNLVDRFASVSTSAPTAMGGANLVGSIKSIVNQSSKGGS